METERDRPTVTMDHDQSVLVPMTLEWPWKEGPKGSKLSGGFTQLQPNGLK